MRKRLFFNTAYVIFCGCAIFLPFSVLADIGPKPLEITYPPFEGAPAPVGGISLPNYIRYAYFFFLAISGIAALVIITLAGFRYMVSAGAPEKMADAKDQIKSALLGIVILFSSFLLLRTINPQLVILRELKELPPILTDLGAGIVLCKQDIPGIKDFLIKRVAAESMTGDALRNTADELATIKRAIDEHCKTAKLSGDLEDAINDKATFAYVVPSYKKSAYGAVLYENSGFGGEAQVIYDGAEATKFEEVTPFRLRPGISSAILFRLNNDFTINRFVTLFTYPGLEGNTLNSLVLPPIPTKQQFLWVPALPKQIGSLRIEGRLIVIFFKKTAVGWDEYTELTVFTQTNANLYNSKMGAWDPLCTKLNVRGEIEQYPCAKEAMIITADPF